jgi:hypothetical protein
MGLLDRYRQFEALSEEEVNARLRAEARSAASVSSRAWTRST